MGNAIFLKEEKSKQHAIYNTLLESVHYTVCLDYNCKYEK